METDRKIYLLLFTTCLTSLTGCATTVRTTAVKPETVQKSVVTYPVSNPVESVILSRIPTLHAGGQGTAGSVSFIAGEAYTAASGRQCRPVTLTENRSTGSSQRRVACKNSHNWFFSKDVFLTGYAGD